MGMMEAVRLFFKNYTNFQGRSRRAEYWWVFLFNLLVIIVPYVLMFTIGGFAAGDPNIIGIVMAIIVGVYGLAVLIPSIALGVRRFHDLGQTGWLLLAFIVAGVIPIIGFLAVIGQYIWFAFPGTAGPNKYGPDPKANIAADTFS